MLKIQQEKGLNTWFKYLFIIFLGWGQTLVIKVSFSQYFWCGGEPKLTLLDLFVTQPPAPPPKHTAYRPVPLGKTAAFPFKDASVFSPELQTAIAADTVADRSALVRRDVFFLGLLLLDCLTLGSLSLANTVQLTDVTAALLSVRDEYSETLFRVVREMLVMQPTKRPDALTMLVIAQKHLGQ